MEIKNISQRILRSTPNKAENGANHTNPFGVNFKGNMINADVFEPSFCGTKESLATKAAGKGKLWAAAMVDSMNPIKNFGNKIKTNITNAWDMANRIEINILPDMKKMANQVGEWISDKSLYSKTNLGKRNKSELEAMLNDKIAIRLLGV